MVEGRVEVARNTRRLAFLCGGFAFCALGALVSLAYGVVVGEASSIAGGLLGLVFFGAPAWSLSKPLRHPSPALVIDADGFEDRTGALVDPVRVPWSQVVELGVRTPWSRYGRRYLVVVRLHDRDAVLPPGLRRHTSDLLRDELGFDHAIVARLTALTPEDLLDLLERHRPRNRER